MKTPKNPQNAPKFFIDIPSPSRVPSTPAEKAMRPILAERTTARKITLAIQDFFSLRLGSCDCGDFFVRIRNFCFGLGKQAEAGLNPSEQFLELIQGFIEFIQTRQQGLP